jgi:hypothetical protein
MEGKQGSDGTPGPLAASCVYACHARLAQIMSDAVHDGIIPRSPCSRHTSYGYLWPDKVAGQRRGHEGSH